MPAACVELCLEDGTLLSIDCAAVKNEVANSMYQQSELNYLIYNDPVAYANLIVNGNPDLYLKAVTKNSIRLTKGIHQKQYPKDVLLAEFFFLAKTTLS